jgi:hypothetical protein
MILGVINIAINEVYYLIRRVPILERSASRYIIKALSEYVSRKTIEKICNRKITLKEYSIFCRCMVFKMIKVDKDLTRIGAVRTDLIAILWLISKIYKPCVALYRILAEEFTRRRAFITQTNIKVTD